MAQAPDTSAYKNLIRMRIPSVGEPVYKARARLARALRRLGLSGERLDGILLAFTEAVTNAVVHGCGAARKCVQARVGTENGRVVIEVTDHGCGFQPDAINLPEDGLCEGGRGLFLMRALMDEVVWTPSPSGTTVRMSKCCIPTAPHTDPVPASTSPVPPTATALPATH